MNQVKTISDLVASLERARKEHGDLLVTFGNPNHAQFVAVLFDHSKYPPEPTRALMVAIPTELMPS